MIIGNWFLARAFKKYETIDDIIIFASWVSNSKNNLKEDLVREYTLLTNVLSSYPNKKIVYFGTCWIYDPSLVDSDYVQHKLHMENIITARTTNYLICRLPNIAWYSQNPNTILNFLYHHIHNDIPFDLWIHAERNILDIADVTNIIDYILSTKEKYNQTITIANTHNYRIIDIVKAFEDILKKNAIYKKLDIWSQINIDTSYISKIYDALNISFDLQYLPRTLSKYYHTTDQNI